MIIKKGTMFAIVMYLLEVMHKGYLGKAVQNRQNISLVVHAHSKTLSDYI